MQTRYQVILDQLHVNKRELSQYRQKYLNIENQLIELQQENRCLKKNNNNFKEQIQKLTDQNKYLISEKQTIMSDYSTSIDSIKEQVEKKQQEIFALRENSYSPLMNQKLLQKQIRCQVESQFQQALQLKQKRIRELTQQMDRLAFDRQMDKQKYQLKMDSMERQLKEIQNSHLIQVQNYANKTYQNSQQVKSSQDQSVIKKLKRQIDEIRMILDQTRQQLSQSVAEKNRLHKQYSSTVGSHRSEKQKLLQQIGVFKRQCQRLSEISNRNKGDRDQLMLKQKDKYIKELKQLIQDQRQEMRKKQTKMSENQIQFLNIQNQLKRIKQFKSKNQSQKINELRSQKQSLMRQINELKYANESIRKNNVELMSQVTQHIQNTQSNSDVSNISKKITEEIINRKHLNVFEGSRVIKEDQRENNSSDENETRKKGMNLESIKNQKVYYQEKLEAERFRNKQLSEKYIELKKKYKNLEHKFKQANIKVVELLKNKVQLGSPTAASKKTFQFPTSPDLKYSKSPQHITGSDHFFQSANLTRTQGNMEGLRNVLQSPDNTVNLPRRGQRSVSSTKGDHSFYQKSLKVKNSQKFRQIRCLNHQNQEGRSCSKSPSK